MNIRKIFSPAFLAIITLIISGAAQFITVKIFNNHQAEGENGVTHYFHKPFFLTWIVFVSQIPVYFYWLWTLYWPDRIFKFPKRSFCNICLAIIPTMTNIIGLCLSVIALIYIPASIDGMLLCSQIIFTAVLTFFVLKQRLWLYQLISVLLAVIAIIFISLASVFGENNDPKPKDKVILGVCLVLIANLCWSAQNVFTEKALQILHPLELTGLQGFIGVIFISFICFPITYYIPGNDPRRDGKSSYENVLDTFKMLGNSQSLSILTFVQFLFQIAFNTSFTYVIGLTSSVNVCIMLVIRTLFVWITLLIWNVIQKQPYTEKWSRWSFSQLFGFLLNVSASFLYNRVIEFSFFNYPERKTDDDGQNSSGVDLEDDVNTNVENEEEKSK